MCNHRCKGMTQVEFTIVATVFFMILFGVIEFGRILYTWNILDEVTRRAARLAAVCPISDAAGITARATFNGNIIHDFTASNLRIEYLDQNSLPTTNFPDIRFIRTSIQNYQFQPFIPFLTLLLDAPSFETVLPSESLGISPAGAIAGGGSINC